MKRSPVFHVDPSNVELILQTGNAQEVVAWPSNSMWVCPVDASIQAKAGVAAQFEVRGIENHEHLFDITPPIPLGDVLLGVRTWKDARRFTSGPALLRASCIEVKPKRVRLQSPERPMPLEPARWVWIYSFEDVAKIG